MTSMVVRKILASQDRKNMEPMKIAMVLAGITMVKLNPSDLTALGVTLTNSLSLSALTVLGVKLNLLTARDAKPTGARNPNALMDLGAKAMDNVSLPMVGAMPMDKRTLILPDVTLEMKSIAPDEVARRQQDMDGQEATALGPMKAVPSPALDIITGNPKGKKDMAAGVTVKSRSGAVDTLHRTADSRKLEDMEVKKATPHLPVPVAMGGSRRAPDNQAQGAKSMALVNTRPARMITTRLTELRGSTLEETMTRATVPGATTMNMRVGIERCRVDKGLVEVN